MDFSVLLKKIHTLNISKQFLYWIFNYLTDRRHFVQIDSTISNILITSFGVPQGYILRLILFNLCVADIQTIYQKANAFNTLTIPQSTRVVKQMKSQNVSSELENELKLLEQCSKNVNLVFYCKKTKSMLFSTRKMPQHHQLYNNDILKLAVTIKQ